MKQRFARFFSSRFGRGLFLGFAGIVALFILLNNVLIPLYVKHGSTLAVPDVVGQTAETARQTLESNGLQPIQAETRSDPQKPAGTVINQNPLPGSTVKHGRRVYLTVSGGEVEVTVPSLRGRTLRDARFSLERYGLKLGDTTQNASDTFPPNTVVDQSIPANTRVAKGSVVKVVVSSGRSGVEVPVPSVVGKSTTEAEKILMQAGLRVGNISMQPSFDLLPNTVVDQYPRPGGTVPRGQAVDLFVVKSGKPEEEIHTSN